MHSISWPAEWQTQEAIWFSWPHRADTWPVHKQTLIRNRFAEIIATTSKFQKTYINAAQSLHPEIRQTLRAATADLQNVHLHDHPTNDVWCRDHGATFTISTDPSNESDSRLHAIDWHFNAWGGKFPPWDLDDKVAPLMAAAAGAEVVHSQLHLEGGAIEGNGEDLLITTEAVALNPNRNPDWTKDEVEKELTRTLGTKKTFWLPSGIEGDDTDGHIDDLTRFVREDAVVNTIETNPRDPNYYTLQRNREILQDLRTVSNSSVEVIDLPMPDPLRPPNWRLETLPASYANFLIINGAVLVPTFDQPRNDQQALGILGELFSNRDIVGIDSQDILWEGGAIHCISQQQPLL